MNQAPVSEPEVGGVFRGAAFPWRQYAQGINFAADKPGVLVLSSDDRGKKMTPGKSARTKLAGEQIWLRSPWPLLLAICGAAAIWTLAAGNPFEGLEMRWFGQVLRWRYERGLAPPADPSIVHVDITQADLRKVPTLEQEYQNAANIIRQAFELGAKVVAFDVIFGRGNEAMAGPILSEVERNKGQNRTVVFAEALLPSPEDGKEERMRSFPFRERVLPAGLINIRSDSDGVLRRYDYVHRLEERISPSLLWLWPVIWPGGTSTGRAASLSLGRDVLRWEELSSDFTSVEPRELKLDPILLNYRSSLDRQRPRRFSALQSSRSSSALYQTSRASNAQPLTNAIVRGFLLRRGLGRHGHNFPRRESAARGPAFHRVERSDAKSLALAERRAGWTRLRSLAWSCWGRSRHFFAARCRC